MSITPDNVLFIYRKNDVESLNIANLYSNIYDLNSSQMFAIDVDKTDILDSYEDFYESIESPVYNRISELSYNVYVIVLGYNIPYAFRIDDPYMGSDPYITSDIISSTSRMSNINSPFYGRERNILFNRQIYQPFDSDDNGLYICSSLAAPSMAVVQQHLLDSFAVKNQYFVYGKFYFDPYYSSTGSSSDSYKEELLSFKRLYLDDKDINYTSTSFLGFGKNSLFPFVQDDSVTWMWSVEDSSSTFFDDTNNYRVFFYNADGSSAKNLMDNDSSKWNNLCMKAGYISSAGALSQIGIEDYLLPLPFFEAIEQGASIGEAFLYSCPYLDWVICLFGDPLLEFKFKSQDYIYSSSVNYSLIDENEIWRLMKNDASRVLAYWVNRKKLSEALLHIIVNSTDAWFEINTIDSVNLEYKYNSDDVIRKNMIDFVSTILNYPKLRFGYELEGVNEYLNNYLSDKNYKISARLVAEQLSEDNISENNLFKDYFFFVEFLLSKDTNEPVDYYFELDVSIDRDFSSIIFSSDSSVSPDIDSWWYEKYDNSFSKVPTGGVPYSYYDKRIRFYPDSQMLDLILQNQTFDDPYSGEYCFPLYSQPYYIRITQRDSNGVVYSSSDYYDIIFSSGIEYEYNITDYKGPFNVDIYNKISDIVSDMQWSTKQSSLSCQNMLELLEQSNLSEKNVVRYQTRDAIIKMRDYLNTYQYYSIYLLSFLKSLHEYILIPFNGDINKYYNDNNIKITNLYADLLSMVDYSVQDKYIEDIM